MSLNQNMSTSSSSSSSSSDHGIPKFPDNTKVDYVYWRMMMRACLAGRGLWFGVVVTSDVETGKTDNDSSSSTKSTTSISLNEKSWKAYYILLQSFTKKQLTIINSIEEGNAAEVWKKIESVYGVVRSTESKMSKFDQLKMIKKMKNESIEDFIAKIDTIIGELKSMGENVSPTMKKYYIIEGLKGLEEWEMDVKIIKKLDVDGQWDNEKFN